MVIGMTIVPRKYFGTLIFNEVYCELLNAARDGKTINYKPVAHIMGLALGKPMGHHWANETGKMLGEISEYECEHGRPMLSAVVVNKTTKKPGPGFSHLARELGKLDSSSPDAENGFWETELQKVYNTWR